MKPAEVAAGMTVQTVSLTTFQGVVGYRAACECGWKEGADTEAQALTAARRHGKRKHSS